MEPYGWQIEGHHLIINYFVLGDQVVMTPTFMGSEPNHIDSGEHKGLRTFEVEERKGLNFYLSLNRKQKEKATFFHKKDYDFNRSEAFRDNEIIATTGIAAKELSKKQKNALLDLIAEYVNNITEGQAKIKMEDVRHHLNETHFTWVQGDKTDGPFYYRIHLPVAFVAVSVGKFQGAQTMNLAIGHLAFVHGTVFKHVFAKAILAITDDALGVEDAEGKAQEGYRYT